MQNRTKASRRQAPFKIREPRIIVIESDPLAAELDGQCRKPCIRHQVATGVRFCAKAFENLPVPLVRLNDHTMGLSKQGVTEPEHLVQAAGLHKDLGVGRDADHTAQDLRSHTVTRIAVDYAVEPDPAGLILGGIRTKGVHKDVDVGKDHGAFMTSSRSLERFRSTPGRTPPVALDTGNSTRLRRLVFGLARMSAKPSSTSDVRVRSSSAARFLARFSRYSFILMVVLMHQYITLLHQYVKQCKMSEEYNAASGM